MLTASSDNEDHSLVPRSKGEAKRLGRSEGKKRDSEPHDLIQNRRTRLRLLQSQIDHAGMLNELST